MKTIFALFLVLATVYRGAESVSKCFKAASGPGYAGGLSGDCTGTELCFENVKVAVADGAKLFEKGCVDPCTDVGVPALSPAGTMWVLQNCCDGDTANTGPPAGVADCNSIDLSTTTTLGPKCMECDAGTDETCMKGGPTATETYKEGEKICSVLKASCYVERKDGKVSRGCRDTCVSINSSGQESFTKCCISGDYCNIDDARYPGPGAGGGGDGDGAQAVFASYFLVFSCLLLAYLK